MELLVIFVPCHNQFAHWLFFFSSTTLVSANVRSLFQGPGRKDCSPAYGLERGECLFENLEIPRYSPQKPQEHGLFGCHLSGSGHSGHQGKQGGMLRPFSAGVLGTSPGGSRIRTIEHTGIPHENKRMDTTKTSGSASR